MGQSDKFITANIHRIQGQLLGIEHMMAQKRECSDVLIQLMAIKSAIDSLALKIISNTTVSCIRSGSKNDLKRLQKTLDSVFKYI